MLKDPLFLIVLVAIAAVVLLRKRWVPSFVDVTYPRLPTGNPSVQSTSTLIGPRAPAPFSGDTRGSHFLNELQILRRN